MGNLYALSSNKLDSEAYTGMNSILNFNTEHGTVHWLAGPLFMMLIETSLLLFYQHKLLVMQAISERKTKLYLRFYMSDNNIELDEDKLLKEVWVSCSLLGSHCCMYCAEG